MMISLLDGKSVPVSKECKLSYRVIDASVNEVALEEGVIKDSIILKPDIANSWSPENPYLYTFEVKIEDSDYYTQKIGLRTVRVVEDAFLLNGSPVYFTGCGLHEDFHFVGHGHCDARLVRDFTMLKNMGANSFRTSHYPYDDGLSISR